VKRTVPVNLMSQALTDREVKEYQARRHLPIRQKQHRAWDSVSLGTMVHCSQDAGKTLAIWQLIHHRSKISRQSRVTLPHELLVEVGISRDAKDRALKILERHGLIRIDRRSGRSARIALVVVGSDREDKSTIAGGVG